MSVSPGPGPVPSTLQTFWIERFQNSIAGTPSGSSLSRWPSSDDGAVARGAVDPVVRLGDVRLDARAEVVLADRGVDLGVRFQASTATAIATRERDAERRRPEARADGEERGGREQTITTTRCSIRSSGQCNSRFASARIASPCAS